MTISDGRRCRTLLAIFAVTVTVLLAQAVPASASSAAPTPEVAAPAPAAAITGPTARATTPAPRYACGRPRPGHARCFAQFRTPGSGKRTIGRGSAAAPTALPMTPARLRSAYQLPAGAGAGKTVAIVDAFDNPKAESDLAIYRKKYALAPCTTANGCFRKVNQKGVAAPLPQPDEGWGVEISLDLDAVSAACPACHILLVEGNDDSLTALGAATNTAVRLGADVVSNSYGIDEFGGMRALGKKYYVHPGVPIIASSGDFGFGPASFPAVLSNVVAVGGTTLLHNRHTARRWTERAWAGAGSGCSAYVAKPAWQPGTHCLMRNVVDISAVADPDTGLLVVDNFGLSGTMQIGGTSLAAPLIAAMYAMSGNTSTINNASRIYATPGGLWDVVGGSNGYCGGDYLCTGKRGYDGPTGMGTPHGLSAL